MFVNGLMHKENMINIHTHTQWNISHKNEGNPNICNTKINTKGKIENDKYFVRSLTCGL